MVDPLAAVVARSQVEAAVVARFRAVVAGATPRLRIPAATFPAAVDEAIPEAEEATLPHPAITPAAVAPIPVADATIQLRLTRDAATPAVITITTAAEVTTGPAASTPDVVTITAGASGLVPTMASGSAFHSAMATTLTMAAVTTMDGVTGSLLPATWILTTAPLTATDSARLQPNRKRAGESCSRVFPFQG